MDTEKYRQRPDKHVSPLVEYTAGFKLLDKFTAQWEKLHSVSEITVNKSKRALDLLNQHDRDCKTRLVALDSFITSHKTLTTLEDQITSINCDINSLAVVLNKIEECLSVLADRKQQIECDEFIRRCEGNYEALVQREKIRSEVRRDELMAEHLRRVQNFEKNQQESLEERRKVLKDQFDVEKARHLDKSKSEEVGQK